MVMPTLTVGELEIPFDVMSLEGFRAWVQTLGEDGPRVCFYDGDVFVEMMQSYRSHGPVVSAVNRRLAALADQLQLGVYFDPPSWITCAEANLSTEPDGFLVRFDRLRRGEVRVNPDLDVELQGRPDFVFEALSRTPSPDADGWLRSPTWSRAFRLRRLVNPGGLLDAELEVRPLQ